MGLNSVSWTLEFVGRTLKLSNEAMSELYPVLSRLTEKQIKLIQALCFKKDKETLADRLKEWEFIYKEKV